MGCRKIKKLLGPFIDDELSEQQRQQVADHLERCASCRHRLESLQKVEALGRQLPTTEPDEPYWSTFLPRLRVRITRAQKKSPGQKIQEAFGRLFAPPVPWVRIAGAVATAVLVFILGHAVIHHEIRMRRVRALPKKLLTEQARVRKDKEFREEVGQVEPQAGPPLKPAQPQVLRGDEITGPLEEEPAEKIVSPDVPSPPPSEDLFLATDQTTRLREQIPTEKGQMSPAAPLRDEGRPVGKRQSPQVFDLTEEKQKTARSMASAGRAPSPDHWRRQIHIWQDTIKAHPRSQQLGQFHLHLAEGWYRLALATTQREDLLQALEAHLAALDFATEEPVRELLRSRVQILEERLRKK